MSDKTNGQPDDLDIRMGKIKPERENLPGKAPQVILNKTGIRDNPRVFFSIEAWLAVWRHALEKNDREIGGILAGETYLDKGVVHLDITEALEAKHTLESSADLTFTHETWNELLQELDAGHPDKRIVGWYHSHPGLGVFLSEQDRFIHENFFTEPFHVALVVDPAAKTLKLFQRTKNKYLETAHIYVYFNRDDGRQMERVVGCYYPHEEVNRAREVFTRFCSYYADKHGVEKLAVCFDEHRCAAITPELIRKLMEEEAR